MWRALVLAGVGEVWRVFGAAGRRSTQPRTPRVGRSAHPTTNRPLLVDPALLRGDQSGAPQQQLATDGRDRHDFET